MNRISKSTFFLFLLCIHLQSTFADNFYYENSTQQPSFLSFAENIDLHFDALIMQPTASNLHYAVEADPVLAPTQNWFIHDINTQYHFGFDVGLKYRVPCSGSYVSLDWQRFHSSDSSSHSVGSDNMIGPFFDIGPDAAPYKLASGKVLFHFDEIDLKFGSSLFSFGPLGAHVFAGVAFTRIKQAAFSRFSNEDGTILRKIKTPSTFAGAGPKVGLDFMYKISRDFNFTGGTSFSVLVGSVKNYTQYKAYSPALAALVPPIAAPNLQTTTTIRNNQVVPALEGNLGFSYDHKFCNQYTLKFEVGYAAQVYLKALQTTDISTEAITPPVAPNTVGVYARSFQKTLSDFALSGPYITLDFGF